MLLQQLLVEVDEGGVGNTVTEADDGKDDEGDHHRGYHCIHHIADVAEERHIAHGGGQYGGVAQG